MASPVASLRRARPQRASSTPVENLEGYSGEDLRENETPENPVIDTAFAAPSNPLWRRRRLLNIGAEHPEPSMSTPLNTSASLRSHYGTVPTRQFIGNPIPRPSSHNMTFSASTPVSPVPPDMHRSQSSIFTTFRGHRISAYDQPPMDKGSDTSGESPQDENINGVRVWYSSFNSIDWLHDAIKDSMRMVRLRRRRSLRGRIANVVDRSLGWIVVTIVGLLTAMAAFAIARIEQWLFDIKEGYCNEAWWRAKRFCCPVYGPASLTDPLLVQSSHLPFNSNLVGQPNHCLSWSTWSEVIGPATQSFPFEDWYIEYTTYTLFALSLAFISAVLTIKLTASNSFVTWKDSVLSPKFQSATDKKTDAPEKRKIMYFAAGSGIPEVKTILSGFVIHGYLGGRTLFTKSVGLALSVASGLSLGKEGPFVHIACCIGNIVSRWFIKYEMNEGKRREILSAGAAAGVSVAFGAPVGGVLFSLEEVSYFFPAKVMWRSLWCAMTAAVTLKYFDPFGTGKLVLFQVTYDKDWHAYELFFFLILGLFGGVYGAYFSKLNYRWARHVRSTKYFKTHPILEVLLVTLVTTLLCFLNPYTRMGGTELVYNLFAECQPGDGGHDGLCLKPGQAVIPVVRAIGTAMVVKAALTVVTFGIKVPAGLFIPTLGVGACFGRIMGLAVQHLQRERPDLAIFEACRVRGDADCVIPGMYAMIGAAAALSGVTRTTISLVVIMFELTRSMNYVVPVMLAILVAKTVADALEPKGIYDLVIELSELPYLDSKREYLWGSHTIHDVMQRPADTIRADEANTVQSLRDQLLNVHSEDGGFPITHVEDGHTRLIGYIGVNELEHALTIVADEASATCYFFPSYEPPIEPSASVSSLYDMNMERDPFDFTIYMDQAPLTVNSHSPLELVHQMFTKLGARYVIVINPEGFYEGIIDKKEWLGFLGQLRPA